jgi:hypothetical protein
MRKLSVAVMLAAFTLGLVVGQNRQVKQVPAAQIQVTSVQVTSRTLAKQPKNKAYTMDLTRRDAYYEVASDADRARIQVRTAKGNMSLADLLRKSNRTTTGVMRVGATSVIRGHLANLPTHPGTLNFNCEGLLCSCSGDVDCNDMFTNGHCGDIAGCDERGCWCLTL